MAQIIEEPPSGICKVTLTITSPTGNSFEQTIEQEFDERGNTLRVATDLDNDGTIDVTQLTENIYDDNGNLIEQREDQDGDGTPEQILKFVYDENNNLLQELTDSNADGMTDRTTTNIYDANNNLIEITVIISNNLNVSNRKFATNGNVIESTSFYPNGNPLFKQQFNADEQPIEIITFNEDGTTDRVNTRIYDNNGNLIEDLFDAFPENNPDGIPESGAISEYDSNNEVTKTTRYNTLPSQGNPGVIRSIETSVNLYDTNGNLIERKFDALDDGTFERIDVFVYDTNGNLVKESNDFDGDNIFSFIKEFTYDGNGNIIERTEFLDVNDDGAPDRIAKNTFDTDGTLLIQTVDDGADGTIDASLEFDFLACPRSEVQDLPLMSWWQLLILGVGMLFTLGLITRRNLF
ncbi:MAG: hypothetical protein AAF705_07935 [Bacteroidota bacterium]